MRLPVELRKSGCKPAQGLLIELSAQGARISNVGQRTYEQGEAVTLELADGRRLDGTVRWAHDRVVGVRLAPALHLPEMSELIATNRELAEPDRELIEEPQARYGT